MNKSSGLRQGLGIAFRLGIELTVATLMGTGIGYLMDRLFGTEPWFLALGVMIGGAAGCLNVYRIGMEMTFDSDQAEDQDINKDDEGKF